MRSVKVSFRDGERGSNKESEKLTEINEMRDRPRSCGQRFHQIIAEREDTLVKEKGTEKNS